MPIDVVTCLLMEKLRDNLNLTPSFKRAAKGWSAKIIVKILPEKDIPYIYKTYLEIKDGKCIDLRALEPEEEVDADIIIEMGISTYVALLSGKTSSTQAFLTRKIKARGKVRELLLHKAVLDELNKLMNRLLFGGEAIEVLLPLLKREFFF